MRLETKFVQVPNDPSYINAINNLAAVWGWTVQSIQVTDSKVSYEGDSYGWVSDYGAHVSTEIITEHTNYASITYQRNIDDPKHAKLSEFETAYNECDDKWFLSASEQARYDKACEDADKERKKYKKFAIIAGVVSAYVLLVACLVVKNPLPLIAGIAVTVYFAKKSSKALDRNPDYNELFALNESRREARKQELNKSAQQL